MLSSVCVGTKKKNYVSDKELCSGSTLNTQTSKIQSKAQQQHCFERITFIRTRKGRVFLCPIVFLSIFENCKASF
jgi:hypothetical protein